MTYIETFDLIGSIKDMHKELRPLDKDFRIYEISYRPVIDHPFKISEYGCCICLEGEATGTIDLMPGRLKPSSLAINVPGQLLEQHSISLDFRGIGIVMSRDFIKGLGLPYNFQLDRMLRETPVIELRPSQLDAMLSYCSMVRRLLETERPFQAETLRHLTCAFFYGIGSYLYQLEDARMYSNEEVIMHRFLTEVKVGYKKHRRVLFYADRLHLSASYLSVVVKNVSGKTPSDWLDDYIVEDARALLKGTNLTIQQISNELGFPSQSFFGKFFKRVVGVSPKEYRDG